MLQVDFESSPELHKDKELQWFGTAVHLRLKSEFQPFSWARGHELCTWTTWSLAPFCRRQMAAHEEENKLRCTTGFSSLLSFEDLQSADNVSWHQDICHKSGLHWPGHAWATCKSCWFSASLCKDPYSSSGDSLCSISSFRSTALVFAGKSASNSRR